MARRSPSAIRRSKAPCPKCGGRGFTMRIVGPTLRGIRKRSGLTVPALAERIGVSDAYLSMVELGRRAISARVLRAYQRLQLAQHRRAQR